MLQDVNATNTEWEAWAIALHRWGLEDLAASILEAAGPLTLLGAQAIYFCEPFLRAIFPDRHLGSLAEMLEDGARAEAFSAYLREGERS